MAKRVRVEQDGFGKLEIPAEALYGIQTQRAVENFPVSGLRMPPRFLRALGLVKAAAALANGTLDWATSFIPDIDNTFVAKDPEHHKYWFNPSSLVAYSLNLETPDENNRKAFNDVNFRRAMSMLNADSYTHIKLPTKREV
jgi:hypothetical protein